MCRNGRRPRSFASNLDDLSIRWGPYIFLGGEYSLSWHPGIMVEYDFEGNQTGGVLDLECTCAIICIVFIVEYRIVGYFLHIFTPFRLF